MCDDDQRSGPTERADGLHHLSLGIHVERARHFVKHQHVWIVVQRARDAEALTLATQPAYSGRQYAFSCYRATEYVILLAMAQEARDHNPDLLTRLERQWSTRAIMSGTFQETLLRELGSQDQPLPMHWYVPGDRVWFRNPDDASSEPASGSGPTLAASGGPRPGWGGRPRGPPDSRCMPKNLIPHRGDGPSPDRVIAGDGAGFRAYTFMTRLRPCERRIRVRRGRDA